jgi:hypothetical protein
MRRRIAHPAGIAARADTAALARKGREQITATVIAMPPQEAVSKDAAIKVGAKSAFDVPWQATLVSGSSMRQKGSR